MMYKDEFRRNGFTGIFCTERGYVQISEDYHGEGYHIETWDNLTDEFQKIYLRGDEIFALAKAGVIDDVFGISELSEEVSESCDGNEKRERFFKGMTEDLSNIETIDLSNSPTMPLDLEADYDAAFLDLFGDGGGDVSVPEYYPIEGWGVQKLSNGGFEIYPEYK